MIGRILLILVVATQRTSSQSCNPPCVSGICSNGTCRCFADYEGRLCDRAICRTVVCVRGKCIDPNVCDCTGTGYDGPTCNIDINECRNGVAKCAHYCTNTPGSYTCSCRDCYVLDSSGGCTLDRTKCLIGNSCYSNGERSPQNQCMGCVTAVSNTSWSPMHVHAVCNDSNACTQNDVCDGVGKCAGTPFQCAGSIITNHCSDKPDGNYPYPSSCRQFMACSGRSMFVFSCPANLEYNANLKYCDYPDKAGCSMTCVARADGWYPHPLCSKFIMCSNQRLHEMNCPSNLHFNPILKVCDFQANAKCKGA